MTTAQHVPQLPPGANRHQAWFNVLKAAALARLVMASPHLAPLQRERLAVRLAVLELKYSVPLGDALTPVAAGVP